MWWVNLTDDTVGTETQKERPCLVIKMHPQTKLVTVIPCTKTLDALRFPFTSKIKANSTNRLSYDSVVMIFQIRSLHFSRFFSKQGKIGNVKWEIVSNLLRDYLDL